MDGTGPHLTSWAWLQHGRAWEHTIGLADQVRGWQVDLQSRADAALGRGEATDPLSLGAWPPPVQQWGLVLAEAVGGLRGCLDAVVWSYADPATLSARQRRGVGFPIVADASRWASDGARRLRTLPAPVVERIRSVQPFLRPEHERPRDPLLLLDGLAELCRSRQPLTVEICARDTSAGCDAEMRLLAPTTAGPLPVVETLEALVTQVAMVLTHVGAERWGVIAAPETLRAGRGE